MTGDEDKKGDEYKTDTTNFLEEAPRAFGCEQDPVNEFTHFSFCLAGAFPHVFMFGESYDAQEDR